MTINKKHFKQSAKGCAICKSDDYETLDVHRILPGHKGGKYTQKNCVCLCANCHRKLHAGKLAIKGKFYCSNGKWMLQCEVEGEEQWIEDNS